MENLQLDSERQINSLTVAELENLIVQIVRQVIKQEMKKSLDNLNKIG